MEDDLSDLIEVTRKNKQKKNKKLLGENTLLDYINSEEFKKMNNIKDKKPLTLEDI